MATQINRFKTVANGNLRYIGNTLGLSKATGVNEPGIVYSIGAFTTTDTTLVVPGGWPNGTTLDYTLNSSSAELNLPAGAEVLYAELVWAGTCVSKSAAPNQNVTANIDDDINFTDSKGTLNAITPDPATSIGPFTPSADYQNSIGAQMYIRSANVTDIVKSSGSGTYTAGKVPSTIDPLNNLNQCCGWTLGVAYSLPSEDLRFLNIDVSNIQAADPPATLSGFQTPLTGTIVAKMFVAMAGGDVGFQVDRDIITMNKINLESPNNPSVNFACSQINDETGNLVTTGTFGDRNADPFTNTQIEAGRQGWDITAVDISPMLTNNQTSTSFDIAYKGGAYPSGNPKADEFFICLLGYAINAAKADVVLTKTPSSEGITPGETITYTISVDNSTGSLDATNVVLVDTLPTGAVFVVDSVKVGGTPAPGVDPEGGIPVGTVAKGSSVDVEFDVVVDAVPSLNPLENVSSATYSYTSSGVEVIDSGISNTATTFVGDANFEPDGVLKSVDTEFVTIGDTITYTVELTNNGNVDALNCSLLDTIPNGLSFVAGSLVGGAGDPNTGIDVSSIPAGGTQTVEFKVSVDTIPDSNPIVNQALLNYEFNLVPLDPNKSAQKISNDVSSKFVYVNINPDDGSLLKEQDKDEVKIGDQITYTITFNNTGTGDVSATITDSIPVGTEFVAGSVVIDSIPNATANPQTGIDVGTVIPGDSSSISFVVDVVSIPDTGEITNIGTLDYSYLVNPSNPPITNAVDTNAVVSSVVSASFSDVTKSVDKEFADVGDTITYTINASNIGNTDAINVVLTDTLASSGVSLVDGSVTVNGDTSTDDPQAGINIGTVSGGDSIEVIFKVKIDEIPTPNPVPNSAVIDYEFIVSAETVPGQNITNEVSTTVNSGGFSGPDGIVKSSDKDSVIVGESLTYTITIKNTGNLDVTDAVIFDTLPSEVGFIDGSAKVDATPSTDSPLTGISVGTVTPGQSVVISFDVLVNSQPTPSFLSNTASINYSYIVDPSGPPKSGANDSNEIQTSVETMSVEITKSVDKTEAVLGETLTYTVAINNTGTVSVDNLVLTDTLPNQVSYVEGSVSIDGTLDPSQSILTGVTIASLDVGASTEVSFKAKA